MECRAYCTASVYNIKALHERLKQQGVALSLYRDVLHQHVPGEYVGDIFYFSYGAVVFWGFSPDHCEQHLATLIHYEEEPLSSGKTEIDEFTFSFGQTCKIIDDEIILPDQEMLTRLAISHALAQSVKLATYEYTLRRTFEENKGFPQDLAKNGRIALSRKEIRRKMGRLFIERATINLHLDVLDTPEFFWEYPELEPVYAVADSYLDIDGRVEVMNHRLDVIHELFEMLGNELNHQHSSRLEWTVIVLIVIEVLLSLLDAFRAI